MASKCRGCSKTVYVMDQQVGLPDGSTFHKACFRCRHCSASLQPHPTKFNLSPDGLLYCNPHFQLHHNTKDQDASAASPPPQSPPPQSQSQSQSPPPPPAATAIAMPQPAPAPAPAFTRSPSKAAILFSGTQDKCVTCSKTVYPLEKVAVEGQAYHKSCFRCSHGGCSISPSNYAALEGVLYCKHHFKQLFKEKGSYNHIVKSASIKRTQPIPSSASDA